MRTRSWMLAAVCVVATAPGIARAQEKEDPEDFSRDIVGGIFDTSHWDVFAYGGWTTNGQFLLQSVGGGERELLSSGSWNAGLGVGVDILKRLGGRLSYTASSGDLVFRTDNGDGSAALNADNLATIKTSVLDAELIHFMLPVRSKINPYASIGLIGAWWKLADETPTIVASGGSSQFRWGANASAGVELGITHEMFARLEWHTASLGNPFSGADSYTVSSGNAIDEPTSVNKTDWRIALLYRFGR